MRLRRTALAALTGVLAGLIVSVSTTGPALAEEAYVAPAEGAFSIEGHGWGHGHGMSQYGAQGAASLGKTADEITAFYYPGTTKQLQANAAMRVLLTSGSGADTQVFPVSGLVLTDLATGVAATLPRGPDRWRSVVDSAGLHVQQFSNGTWQGWALGGKTVHAGPLQFAAPTFVRVAYPGGTSRDYRGVVRSVKLSATSLASVNALPMESYLRGVVPRESVSSWKPAALQAQAIAARSYSTYKRDHTSSSGAADICDSTQCQVYGGAGVYGADGSRTALEPTTTDDAISATAGVVRTYGGAAILAEFSSSNGGWSTDGGLPYLVAQRDDWDGVTGSSVHSWTATLTTAQIEARYPSVGKLQRISVTGRDGNGDWGGRVNSVVLEGVNTAGQATSVRTTGAGLSYAHSWPANSDGLRSSWWHVVPATASSVVAQSTAPVLVRSPGASTGTVTASLKNVGTTTWSTTGLHLAVASPPGEADPLVGGSATPGTYVRNRTHPGDNIVAPGDIVDVSFALTGDGVRPGSYGRTYRLRNGGGELFGAPLNWVFQVVAPRFTAVAATAPVALAPRSAGTPSDEPKAVFADGKTVVVPINGSTGVRLMSKNTGNLSWPVGDATPLHLGTTSPDNRASVSAGPTWLSPGRPARLRADTAVAPGQVGDFDLTLYGAGRPVGVSSEAFEPLWEGQHWLDGGRTSLVVVRVDPARSRLAGTDLAPPATVGLTNAPNGTTVLRVRLRNLGGDPWEVGKESLTAPPTALSTPAWTSSTSPPALRASVTRPGQARVYPGEVGEWLVPLSAYRKAAGSYAVTVQAKGPAGALYGPRLTTKVTVRSAVFAASVFRVSPAVTVPRGGTTDSYVDVKNTGNVAWSIGAAVRSEAFTAGGSPSRAANWLSATRPGPIRSNLSKPGSTSVEPGQVARFVITLAGNGRTPGARAERFGVLWENWRRVGGLTATVNYTVR